MAEASAAAAKLAPEPPVQTKPAQPLPQTEAPPPPVPSKLRSLAAPLVVLLLAAAVVIAITWNWNAWEGGKIDQQTNDAFVRGDLTPLSTKVSGLVREVKVEDYQRVHKGDVLVELEDDDYKAQIAQANAAVEGARAALENNRRQRELQDSRIEHASAGISQATAQITAAQAGIAAVQADVNRTHLERTRQESLLQARATTQQKVELAVADEQRLAAQASSRAADLEQAKALLRGAELGLQGEHRTKAVLESQTAQLLADLHAKEAQLVVAQVNLGYTRIAAPADGTIGERQVRKGQLVSPGTQVLTFLDNGKWVQANYRETQLTHMQVGDKADIRLDVYPDQVLHGTVLQIAPASGSQFALLPPDNATGNFTKVVQRVPVKIALENSSLNDKLRPGLSAVVSVQTRR